MRIIKVYIPESVVGTAVVPSSVVDVAVVPPNVDPYNNRRINVSFSTNNNTKNTILI